MLFPSSGDRPMEASHGVRSTRRGRCSAPAGRRPGHIEFRYQITALAVTLAGTILTLGAQSKNAFVLLMAPTPALFLAWKWYEHGKQRLLHHLD